MKPTFDLFLDPEVRHIIDCKKLLTPVIRSDGPNRFSKLVESISILYRDKIYYSNIVFSFAFNGYRKILFTLLGTPIHPYIFYDGSVYYCEKSMNRVIADIESMCLYPSNDIEDMFTAIHHHQANVEFNIMLHQHSPTEPRKGYVYLIEASDGRVKIGCSKDPEKRIKGVASAAGIIVKNTYYTAEVNNPLSLESKMHSRFNRTRIVGEWFKVDFDKVVSVLNEFVSETSGELT